MKYPTFKLLGTVAGLSIIVTGSLLDFAKRRTAHAYHVQVTGNTEAVSIPVKIK